MYKVGETCRSRSFTSFTSLTNTSVVLHCFFYHLLLNSTNFLAKYFCLVRVARLQFEADVNCLDLVQETKQVLRLSCSVTKILRVDSVLQKSMRMHSLIKPHMNTSHLKM